MTYQVEELHQRCLCPEEHDDYEVVTTKTREGEGLWEKCRRCGLVINRSGVSKQEFDDFYNSTYFEKNSYKKGSVLTAEQHYNQRKNSIQNSRRNFEKYLKPHFHLLEIGSGAGELIDSVKDRVASCFAIEMNKDYVEFIQSSLKIPAASTDYTQTEFDRKFDMILIVNTIDHMYNSLGVLKKLHHDLADDGLLYIEVPNDDQALSRVLPQDKAERFRNFMYQKAHYYSFTFETLEKTLEWGGFELVEKVSKHDYTVNNFLNWCFAGAPMVENKLAKEKTDLLDADHPFANAMNAAMKSLNQEFNEQITKNFLGESICMVARKKS